MGHRLVLIQSSILWSWEWDIEDKILLCPKSLEQPLSSDNVILLSEVVEGQHSEVTLAIHLYKRSNQWRGFHFNWRSFTEGQREWEIDSILCDSGCVAVAAEGVSLLAKNNKK